MLEMYLGIFNEATGRGLEFYADKYPAFIETCRYVRFISNIWKIISVKTPSKGVLLCYKIVFKCKLSLKLTLLVLKLESNLSLHIKVD